MRRMLGFIMFWVAVGMLLMMILPNKFVGIPIVALLLLIGYNLYFAK